ncbi:FKBP12-rapamycin complex-associated protein, putative [Entamoeba invadens IP1]|uniref:Serine/threonine-protein kinase TOR n=1 Tax=Entamoeba invadens IP1 TaxID=370355 RepID=A0A0A1UFZ7_ENTIV|nr:FKBP12-rapamycin complex-associated protein, putative [Entamoeba invadens IP1]ELP92074.1 FKBP12-rapamycin complex-associated protein, putative [Entamoeba invadens IP1]|eukprot:XP_004258845.1 FKBP12-rapamycin complex-associated protein, putative [Entamoeba invadens IP1]
MTSKIRWSEKYMSLFNELTTNRLIQDDVISSKINDLIFIVLRDLRGEGVIAFVEEVSIGLIDKVKRPDTTLKQLLAVITTVDLIISSEIDDTYPRTYAKEIIDMLLKMKYPVVILHAVRLLGKISKIVPHDVVEMELDNACFFLENEPKTTGAMMMYQIATNNEVVCFMNQTKLVNALTNVMYDKNIQSRLEAQKAFGILLRLFTSKEAEGYDVTRLYTQAILHLKRVNVPELQHGAILVLTSLLHNCKDFTKDKYKDIIGLFLSCKETKNAMIKKALIQALPEFASFDASQFAPKNEAVAEIYSRDARSSLEFSTEESVELRRVKTKEPFDRIITYLITTLKTFPERGVIFKAIGDITKEVKVEMYPFLETIFAQIMIVINGKDKNLDASNSVMYCMQQLIEYVPVPRTFTLFYQVFTSLLDNGLTAHLVSLAKKALEASTNGLYKHQIQKMLLDIICGILLGKSYVPFGAPEHLTMFYKNLPPKVENPEQIQLALNTLHTFKFKHNIIEVVKECIMKYIDNENEDIRKEAAMLTREVLPQMDIVKDNKKIISTLHVTDVLEKLLEHALSDGNTEIRLTVLQMLDERFDNFLAQSKKIKIMFIILNDENLKIRERAICIIGRLTKYNPAFVMPSYRITIINLLTQLKYSSDLKINEEASLMIGILVKSSKKLIQPYIVPLMEDLLPKLEESIQKSYGDTCIYLLNAIGDLTTTGGDLRAYVKRLMKCILTVLSDKGNSLKKSERRESSLIALGKLTRSIGYVVQPYYDYPELLGLLLELANSERNETIKLELIKVFGIIGAIDTYRYKLLTEKDNANNSDDNDPTESMLPKTSPGSEEFYTLTVLGLLFKILQDNNLVLGHVQTLETFIEVILYFNTKSLPFIPQILAIYLKLFKTCLPGVRPALIKGLAKMMCLIKKNIREYLPEIFSLIQECWDDTTMLSILSLVCEISKVMLDEYKAYMPKILSLILAELNKYVFDQNSFVFENVINSIVVLSENLDFADYLHLVIPVFADLVSEQVHYSIVLPTLRALYKFLQHVDAEEFISRLVLPLTRLLPNEILRDPTMDVFCSMGERLGKPFLIYRQTISNVLDRTCPKYIHIRYQTLMIRLDGIPDGPVLSIDENDRQNVTISEDLHSQVTKFNQIQEEDTLTKDLTKIVITWDTYKQRKTKEDWLDWAKQVEIIFLKESPIHSLSFCHSLSTDHPPLARDLFNFAFFASWEESPENTKKLVQCLKAVFQYPSTPHEILQILLNLCEFIEREGIKVPINSLGTYAKRCNAYAKALHYKEMEFHDTPKIEYIEELIGLNNQLQNYDAAAGLIEYTKSFKGGNDETELNQTWFEKLGRWQQALNIYEKKLKDDGMNGDFLVGKLNCLYQLGDWEELEESAKTIWESGNENVIETARPLYAAALWYLDRWDDFGKIVVEMTDNTFDTNFFRIINSINKGEFTRANDFIGKERELLDAELSALAGECYERAYLTVARSQMLAELEEVIMFKEGMYNEDTKSILKSAWTEKLVNAKEDVSIWQKLLKIHSFVLNETENSDCWIKYTGLCYNNGMTRLAMKTLDRLAGVPLRDQLDELPAAKLRVGVQYLKLEWKEAKDLDSRTRILDKLSCFEKLVETRRSDDIALKADVFSKLGEWSLYIAQNSNSFNYETIPQILQYYHATVQYDTENFAYWHSWALVNFEVVNFIENGADMSEETLVEYLRVSIEGFVKSLILAKNSQTLQDTLRLLTILFKYGKYQEVEEAIVDGIRTLPVDIWLHVIPQIIARIQSTASVKRVMIDLLTFIGKKHPQALVYPLTVASKSPSYDRRKTAMSVIEKIRADSGHLVEQALLLGEELVRVAVLWHESWHEALEEASREFYINHDFNAMLSLLQPLYEKLEKGGETQHERGFLQSYGKDLKEAYEFCLRFKAKNRTATDKDSDIEDAWEIYFKIYKRIHKSINSVSVLELPQVSPRLMEARDMDIAVPGTYKAQNINNITRIKSIVPVLDIIPSKQRPRKLTIVGSNGVEYKFCLKGHEDLRQDERVMQFFGLVNDLLASSPYTSTHHLNILCYEVIPLSTMSGLIGWVPHSDTFHQLIKEYREMHDIPVDLEKKVITKMAPHFDDLPYLQKVEIFDAVLKESPGMDLANILWLKSVSSEAWMERRTNFTRSVALMSMVGYILGLGDRHPSNLMLQRYTGNVVHIDFGDCFEVAIQREKFPERIPFRLTRMIVNAMDVSGIEGTFRITCEAVMKVLRMNKDSLMAVLEAFVYDPLIVKIFGGKDSEGGEEANTTNVNNTGDDSSIKDKAGSVVKRVLEKLTGKDFGNEIGLNVSEQVDRLIKEAISHENLSQSYQGWCPWW